MIFDSEIPYITLLSLRVSGLATAISLLIGLPFGTLLALGKFPGRSFLLSLIIQEWRCRLWWLDWRLP